MTISIYQNLHQLLCNEFEAKYVSTNPSRIKVIFQNIELSAKSNKILHLVGTASVITLLMPASTYLVVHTLSDSADVYGRLQPTQRAS
jgi:hypothetical protein